MTLSQREFRCVREKILNIKKADASSDIFRTRNRILLRIPIL